MGSPVFRDRGHAGRVLADSLGEWVDRDDVIVLGLPRGGVPVAAEVARALGAPLDVLVVRKLGVPGHVELAMGAVAGGGVTVRNDDVLDGLDIDDATLQRVIATESAEVARREERYRGERPPLDLRDRVAILVDDGLATGATMRAAVAAVRSMGPRTIVVAVPVGAAPSCGELRALADVVVCAHSPADLRAVGWWYDDFTQTSDAEVAAALDDRP